MSTSQFGQPDDLIGIWRHYVHTLLSPADGEEDPAAKALVADEQAMRMITLACPMTFLTEYRVYDVRSLEQMVDALDPQGSRMGNETAYVLLRPTPHSQDNLTKLIQKDVFAAYHLSTLHNNSVLFALNPTFPDFWAERPVVWANTFGRKRHTTIDVPKSAVYTNRTEDSALVALATHDTHGRGGLPKIQTLRDAFSDFIPLDRHLFSVASPFQSSVAPDTHQALGAPLGPLQRPVVEAITAVSAALRCSPVLRYQRGSKRAADVARAASDLVSGSARKVFDFSKKCTVLVLDRSGDAVTPLLTPWTYEAMLHELIPGGIVDNTVAVRAEPGVTERFAVGPAADDFYAAHASDDYGAIGTALSTAARSTLAAVDGLKSNGPSTNGAASTGGGLGLASSVASMRQKLDQSAQSTAAKGLLSRHMRMFEVITDIVNKRGLLETGVSEQAIASGSESAAACIASVRSAADMVAAGAAVPSSVERLIALSALKHEDRAGDIAAAGASALQGGSAAAGLASVAVEFGGLKHREEELFGGGLLGNVKRMMGGGEDMSAYMQHTPLLKQLLELAADGKLDSKKYPIVGLPEGDAQAACRRPAGQIVVIIIGGTTYSESDVVRRFNSSRKRAEKRCSAILGSTGILNTTAFVDMLKRQGQSLM